VIVTLLGIVTGLVIAQIIYYVHKLFITTSNVATAFTLITPYIMYLSAEHFHASGVLSVVSGGLFLSYRSKEILNYKARLQAFGVWTTLIFILNGLIFILIGLQLPVIVSGLRYYSLSEGIRYSLIITGLIIAIRIVWMYTATYLPFLLNKKLSGKIVKPNGREIFLVGWAGMRGVVSLASALAIPVFLEDGNEFPERDLVLFVSFTVILFTLVLQGLTFPWVIKKLNLKEDKLEIPADIQSQQIHLLLMKLSLARLEEKYPDSLQSNTLVKNYKRKLEEDLDFTMTNIECLKEDENETDQVEEFNRIMLDIGEFQTRHLTKIRLQEVFDENVIRREEDRIDLEQNKIG
jgi:monovalent cation/hydrogen antiporter